MSFISSSLALQRRACAAISKFLCFDKVQSEAACRAYCNAAGITKQRNKKVKIAVQEDVVRRCFCFESTFENFHSYRILCFVISNCVVLVPNYWKSRSDLYFCLLSVSLFTKDSDMCPLKKK